MAICIFYEILITLTCAETSWKPAYCHRQLLLADTDFGPAIEVHVVLARPFVVAV